MDINNFGIKGYAKVKGLGVVAVLTDDISGMTYVAKFVRTDMLSDRCEFLVDQLPEEPATPKQLSLF